MIDVLITLIGKGKSFTDENGNEKFEEVNTEVFGNIGNIGQREFAAASQMGLKPELMVEIWSFEYSGEEELKLGDRLYSIYRTYQKGDRLELYLTQRSGINEA
jgi:hypothetical protein